MVRFRLSITLGVPLIILLIVLLPHPNLNPNPNTNVDPSKVTAMFTAVLNELTPNPALSLILIIALKANLVTRLKRPHRYTYTHYFPLGRRRGRGTERGRGRGREKGREKG